VNVQVDEGIYAGSLDDMLFVGVGIILGQGQVMRAAQDDGRLADGREFAQDGLQRRIRIGQGGAGADIAGIGQFDIGMPVNN
jgi:hypothetical protein